MARKVERNHSVSAFGNDGLFFDMKNVVNYYQTQGNKTLEFLNFGGIFEVSFLLEKERNGVDYNDQEKKQRNSGK